MDSTPAEMARSTSTAGRHLSARVQAPMSRELIFQAWACVHRALDEFDHVMVESRLAAEPGKWNMAGMQRFLHACGHALAGYGISTDVCSRVYS